MICAGPRLKGRSQTAGCALILLLLIFSSCSGNGGSSGSSGSLAFKAVWPQAADAAYAPNAVTTDGTEDVCTTFGIGTITATVFNASGTEIGSGSWPCDTEGHRGTIGEIPTGSGYRVVVEGLMASDARWRGERTEVAVNANRTTVIENILMHRYDFIVAASSDGGRIDPAGRIEAAADGDMSFTFAPDSGYAIADVVVDGVSIGVVENHTFSKVDADHTIYVQFTPIEGNAATHTISSSAGEGGTIVPNGQTLVVEGNDQVFAFAPAAGNSIVDVVVDGVSQGAVYSYTFTEVVSDHTISVSFDVPTYTINASAGPGGQIEPLGQTTVPLGATPTYNITANPGFYLASLLINGNAVAPQSPYAFDPVVSNTTIEAVFKPVCFVDAGAAAGGDGATWAGAHQTLADAIAAAAEGDNIWIKAGIYLLSDQVSVNRRVNIFGGFHGTERFLHERDWSGQPVIFDGQAQTRSFFISADARLDGLVIQNSTLGRGYTDLHGGALYIADSSPTVVNCTFLNNYIEGFGSCSGGAIYAGNSSPIFVNTKFEGNALSCENNSGGAIFLNNSAATITQSHFMNNKIGFGLYAFGGGLRINGGTATLSNSTFLSNTVSADSARGGAISTKDADLVVSECFFSKNVSNSSTECIGGAISHNGKATVAGSVIQNSIFLSNSINGGTVPGNANGGALHNQGADPFILNCTFFGNNATGNSGAQGGAISNVSGNPTITNSILWGNQDEEGFQLHDDEASNSTVTHSNIDQDGYDGNGNLRVTPRLDASGRLRTGSACQDAGDDSVAPRIDIDGETRPVNGRSDIGADEFVDSDGDQLPDYWETHYGLDIGSDDRNLDLDADGLTNLYEYQYDLNPSNANPVIDARHRGWYDETGLHDDTENGTRCGFYNDLQYRSYFTFDLPQISSSVVGAVLRLEVAGYHSIREAETLMLYDVVTDVAELEATGSGQTAIFNDLGEGDAYSANVSISPANIGKIYTIKLSTHAVRAISSGLGKTFAVGLKGTSPNLSEDDLVTFSETSEHRTHQLILITE